MKALWAVLCQSSSVDRETNNVSLFNVFEEVRVQAPPEPATPALPYGAVTSALEFIALFRRSDINSGERLSGRFRIQTPLGTGSDPLPIEIDLTSSLRHRVRIRLPALPISGEGTYLFTIEAEGSASQWCQLCEVPLEVIFQTDAPR